MTKLGLIAGGGGLPLALAEQCQQSARPLFVFRLKGFADPGLWVYEGEDLGLGELGKCIDRLRANGCQAVCICGKVDRPDFSSLKLDWRGIKALPGILAAAREGDDALLRLMVSIFEAEGFTVEGAHQVHAGATLAKGALGEIQPGSDDIADLTKAFAVAGEIGTLDIGQGVVVCRGLVLAVEAQEGTDAMLARCAALPPAIRGEPERRRGVLVKRAKPIQEERIDLPTIGVATVEGAARAGLAGIGGEAGRTLIVDREAVIEAANRLGLFVQGLSAQD